VLDCTSPQTMGGSLRDRVNCMSLCWHLNGHLSRGGTLPQGGIAVDAADSVAGPAKLKGANFCIGRRDLGSYPHGSGR